jgi:hypothetical protein
MTIFLMASEVGSITPLSATSYEKVAGATYDSTYSRCAFHSNNQDSISKTHAFSAQTTGYIRFFANAPTSINPGYPVRLTDASGVDWVRLKVISTSFQLGTQAVTVEWYNGLAWTALANFTISFSSLEAFDLYWLGGSASGKVQLFVNNSLALDSGTIDTSAMQAITHLTLAGTFLSPSEISEIIGATVPTINWRLATLGPIGNGANTAWTGDYTGVDEVVYADADFIASGSNGDIETDTLSDPTTSTYVIKGVGVASRAKCDSTGPQNLQHVVRIGSTNYASSSHALNVGYDAYVSIWETSPATSTTWTSTEVANLEAGVKAIT